MFVAHEVAIDVPFAEASERLADLTDQGALQGASGVAYDAGVAAVLRVGPFGSVRGFSKLVHVRFLSPVRRGATMTVAVRWEATGATGELFPVLDIDLIVTDHGDGRSRLAVIGSYRPPFGRAGAALDKAVMHHLATATMRSLLSTIADAIEHQAPGTRGITESSPAPEPASDASPPC